VNAQNNFYGCNGGPGTTGCSSNIGATGDDRYLVLKSAIGTKTLSPGQTTTFTANLNHNNLGETVATPVLDGVPISFTASTYLAVFPATGHLVGGLASTTVKAKATPGGQAVTGQSVAAHVVNATSTQSPISIKASAPPPPALSIGDVSTAEGRSGTHVVYFPVTLSKKSAKYVTVKYATANGSAKAPSDFVAKWGTLILPAGATKGWIGITIKGDKVWEPNENFCIRLYSPVNATISDPNGTGIIRNS
jgi:Calx-beta domain